MIKNIEYEKIKAQRVQTRQEEEADYEKRKIMTYRNKIDNFILLLFIYSFLNTLAKKA